MATSQIDGKPVYYDYDKKEWVYFDFGRFNI